MRNKLYFLLLFLISWLFVLSVRQFGLLQFKEITAVTYAAIFLFIICCIIGLVTAIVIPVLRIKSLNRKKLLLSLNRDRNLNHFVHLVVFISSIALGLFLYKFLLESSRYGIALSLEGVSELRTTKIQEGSEELGSTITGAISSALLGFPLLSGIVALFFKGQLSKRKRMLLNGIFFSSIFFSFLSGGRFTAFTFIFIWIFARKILKKNRAKNLLKRRRNPILWVLLPSVIFVFSMMFLDRRGPDADLSQIIHFFNNATAAPLSVKLVHSFPNYGNVIGIIAYFDYYIAHGINELDTTLIHGFPSNAPYFGGYQFSTFFLFFSKIGIPVLTINKITLELENPGVYITQIGALFLDFGFLGITLFAFLFSLMSGIFWKSFHNKPSILNFYASCICAIQLVMSPMVSIVGTGYFASILITFWFVYIYDLVAPIRIRYEVE